MRDNTGKKIKKIFIILGIIAVLLCIARFTFLDLPNKNISIDNETENKAENNITSNTILENSYVESDIFVVLYTDGTLVFNNTDEFDETIIEKNMEIFKNMMKLLGKMKEKI